MAPLGVALRRMAVDTLSGGVMMMALLALLADFGLTHYQLSRGAQENIELGAAFWFAAACAVAASNAICEARFALPLFHLALPFGVSILLGPALLAMWALMARVRR